MDWLGLAVGIGGLIAGILGLWFAFWARQSAKLARNAAISAEEAANSARSEARRAITRTLSLVGVERAVALIGRLKDVHRQRNWDYALGLYPDLRRMLSEIAASAPENFAAHRDFIKDAIPQLITLEEQVTRSRYENENGEPDDIPNLDATLSEIQQNLEMLQSSIMYADETESN